MTREYYLQHKDAFANRDWTPFDKLELYIKNALESTTAKDQIDVLDGDGRWYKTLASFGYFKPGRIYRINPDWAGPAEPPKPRYIDALVQKGATYYVASFPTGTTCSLSSASSLINFAGFVYPNGIRERLRFIRDADTVKLIVPDAVRFHTAEETP